MNPMTGKHELQAAGLVRAPLTAAKVPGRSVSRADCTIWVGLEEAAFGGSERSRMRPRLAGWKVEGCRGLRKTTRGYELRSVRSLNPRPLKIIGAHFCARAARVFACFAPET